MDYDLKSYKVKEASTQGKERERDKAKTLLNKLSETLKKTEDKYQKERQHNAVKEAKRKHANAQKKLKEAQASLNRREYTLEVHSKEEAQDK